MKKLIFFLILIVSTNAFAAIEGATIHGATIYTTVTTAAATNSLLLEDNFYILHENNDTMQLES